MNCTTCSARTDSRSARKAHVLATGHDAFEPVVAAAAPVARSSWDDRVDEMVAAGWSREYAEAITPMTVAEAKRRGFELASYTSPMTALFTRRAR